VTHPVFGSGLRVQQPVKHKIFVSYHHRGDQAYYEAFSNAFHDTYDVIYVSVVRVFETGSGAN
jgi:hypothetical protein